MTDHFEMIEYANIIGTAAGLIFGSSGIAQAVKIYKMKGGDSLSMINSAMLITGMALWTYYAYLHEAWAFVWWNSFAIGVQLIVVGMTKYYARKKLYLQIPYERRRAR